MRADLVRKAWLIAALADFFFQVVIRIRFETAIGRTVIADRWILDSEIDLKLNFSKDKVTERHLWILIKKCAKSPDIHVVITIPVHESIRRSKLKAEPFPDSADVLEQRLAMYLNSPAGSAELRLDGLDGADQIGRRILAAVERVREN